MAGISAAAVFLVSESNEVKVAIDEQKKITPFQVNKVNEVPLILL